MLVPSTGLFILKSLKNRAIKFLKACSIWGRLFPYTKQLFFDLYDLVSGDSSCYAAVDLESFVEQGKILLASFFI